MSSPSPSRSRAPPGPGRGGVEWAWLGEAQPCWRHCPPVVRNRPRSGRELSVELSWDGSGGRKKRRRSWTSGGTLKGRGLRSRAYGEGRGGGGARGAGAPVAQLRRPVLGAKRGAAASSSCEVSSFPSRDAVAPFRVTLVGLLLTFCLCWGKRPLINSVIF